MIRFREMPDEPTTALLVAECFQCHRKGIYEMDEKETALLLEYQEKGRAMGAKHILFPNVPTWILADCLEPFLIGKVKCPDCMGYKKKR